MRRIECTHLVYTFKHQVQITLLLSLLKAYSLLLLSLSLSLKTEKWTKLTHFKMDIMEALEKLDALVDESDPDVSYYT